VSEGLTLRVGEFEGPLDLLLHLCRTNEIDLAALPVRAITDQYVAATTADPSSQGNHRSRPLARRAETTLRRAASAPAVSQAPNARSSGRTGAESNSGEKSRMAATDGARKVRHPDARGQNKGRTASPPKKASSERAR
jgi:hypothetical protein